MTAKDDYLVPTSKTPLAAHYELAIRKAIVRSEKGDANSAIEGMLNILFRSLDNAPKEAVPQETVNEELLTACEGLIAVISETRGPLAFNAVAAALDAIAKARLTSNVVKNTSNEKA